VSLTQKILVSGLPKKELAAMAKKKAKDQIIVRISMENGVPQVRPLTADEQRQFIKTHPNLKLPTFSPEDIERGLEELEKQFATTHPKSQLLENHITDPRSINLVTNPSAK
jgi:hypothetical protein